MNGIGKSRPGGCSVKRVDGLTLGQAIDQYCITSVNVTEEAINIYKSAPAHRFNLVLGSQESYYKELDTGSCKRLHP